MTKGSGEVPAPGILKGGVVRRRSAKQQGLSQTVKGLEGQPIARILTVLKPLCRERARTLARRGGVEVEVVGTQAMLGEGEQLGVEVDEGDLMVLCEAAHDGVVEGDLGVA